MSFGRGILIGLGFWVGAVASPAMAQSGPKTPRDDAPVRAAKPASSNPCAAFGGGFVRVEGSNTCVKVGGSISVGVGGSR